MLFLLLSLSLSLFGVGVSVGVGVGVGVGLGLGLGLGVGVGVGVGFVGCCPECDQAHFLLPHIKVCRKSNSVARGPNAEGARHLSL